MIGRKIKYIQADEEGNNQQDKVGFFVGVSTRGDMESISPVVLIEAEDGSLFCMPYDHVVFLNPLSQDRKV